VQYVLLNSQILSVEEEQCAEYRYNNSDIIVRSFLYKVRSKEMKPMQNIELHNAF